MTQLVEKVFSKVEALPVALQEEWAARVLAEFEEETVWNVSLNSSESKAFLEDLISEARAERQAGTLRTLNPDEIGL
jgi:polyhydroxyalkanoate synthesis regulator phasin